MHREAVNKFVKRHDLDAKIFSFRELQTCNEPIDNLIIPSRLPTKDGQKLRNYRYAKKHIFFGSSKEIELSKLWVERDARSFESTFGVNTSKPISKRKISELDSYIKDADPIEEMLTNFSRHIEKNFISHESTNHNIEAILMVLPEDKIILLPEGGKWLVQKPELRNKIDLIAVKEISLGDEILISNNNLSGEMLLDFILRGDTANYNKYKSIESMAKSWKKELINFKEKNKLSLEQLVSELSKFDVSRNPLTVKYWLEESFTIAPKYEGDLSNIFKMVGKTNTADYKNCRDSIVQLHELTSEARKKLVSIINDQMINYSNSMIKVKIGNQEVIFEQEEVLSSSKTLVDRKYLYHLMTFNQLFGEQN